MRFEETSLTARTNNDKHAMFYDKFDALLKYHAALTLLG